MLSLIAIVTVASCEKDIELLEDRDGNNCGIEVRINANQGADNTRTSLDGLAFTWTKGDALGVYNSATNNAQFILNGNGGSNNEDFGGRLSYPTNNEGLCAIYPYDASRTFAAGGKYTFTHSTSQIQRHNRDKTLNTTSIGAYTYMYGKTSSVVSGGDINIQMKHIMSIMDFNLVGIPADTKIYSLTLKANKPTFANTVSVDFSGATPIITTGTSKAKEIVVKIGGDSGIVVDGNTLTIRLVMPPQTIEATAQEPEEWIVELKASTSSQTSATDIRHYTNRFDSEVIYRSGRRYKANLNYTTDFTRIPPQPLSSSVFMDYATFGALLTGQFEYNEIGAVSLATSVGDINAAYGANSNYPWLTGIKLTSDGGDSRKGVLKLTYIPHNQTDKRDYILTLNVGNNTKIITIKYDNGYIPNSLLTGSEFAMVTGENTTGIPTDTNRKGWAPQGFHLAKRGYLEGVKQGINPFVDNSAATTTTTTDGSLSWQNGCEASAEMDGYGVVNNSTMITSFEYNRGRAQTLHLIDRHEKQGANLNTHNHAMAIYCHNTGDGWYTPSVSELRWIYDYARPYLGASYRFSTDLYWSASEQSDNLRSWFVHFRTGNTSGYRKDNNLYVRCIKNL